MKTIKWGLIGCGQVAEKESGPAFAQVEGSLLWGVTRRDPVKAEASAAQLGAARFYRNQEELLADPEINAVYISTPPGLHREQALACCRAGKALYLEKPLGRNHTEAQQIVEAFEKARLPLCVSLFCRALPRIQALKHLLDVGAIGAVHAAQLELTRVAADTFHHPWLFLPALSGGGKFYDIAPHTIDLLVYFFGAFTEINATARNTGTPQGLEDHVSFAFKTEKNITGKGAYLLNEAARGDCLIIQGTKGEIRTPIHAPGPMMMETEDRTQEFSFEKPAYIQQPMIEQVVKYLQDGSGTPCFGREALESARIIDEVLDSFYGGRQDDFWNHPERWQGTQP